MVPSDVVPSGSPMVPSDPIYVVPSGPTLYGAKGKKYFISLVFFKVGNLKRDRDVLLMLVGMSVWVQCMNTLLE